MHKEDAHVALPGASLNGPTDSQIDEVLCGEVVSAFMGNGLNFIDALDRFPYTQLSLCGLLPLSPAFLLVGFRKGERRIETGSLAIFLL